MNLTRGPQCKPPMKAVLNPTGGPKVIVETACEGTPLQPALPFGN
jgi:hypothetical protein